MILGWLKRRKDMRDEELAELREFAEYAEQVFENVEFLLELQRREGEEIPLSLSDTWEASYHRMDGWERGGAQFQIMQRIPMPMPVAKIHEPIICPMDNLRPGRIEHLPICMTASVSLSHHELLLRRTQGEMRELIARVHDEIQGKLTDHLLRIPDNPLERARALSHAH